MSFAPDKLLNVLRGLPAAQCYRVGFSGGLDSTVLLQAMARLRAELGGELRAVHVNHHIHPDSDSWGEHCQQLCAELEIACDLREIRMPPVKGASLEALARERRYVAYRELLRSGDLLLLAHHQDDQLETFLLQALRGAGVRGLAAMPQVAACGAGQLARPLLGFTREHLQTWAQTQGFAWLEDPSNADARFDRNYLRQRVIPLLRARWPAAAATASRSAQHCAEADELLGTLAAQDLRACAGAGDTSLAVDMLQSLGVVRAKNLLRVWIAQRGLPPPSARKLEQVFTELLPARADRNPCVAWDGAELRRYRGRLYAMPTLPAIPVGEFRLRPGLDLNLGAGCGSLSLQAVVGAGLCAAACPANGFEVRFRTGGELCRPAGGSHHRPLKKWLQEQRILPWMRARLPLVYAGASLVAVADLFVCAPFAAGEHEPGLRIQWRVQPQLRQ